MIEESACINSFPFSVNKKGAEIRHGANPKGLNDHAFHLEFKRAAE